ncbi:MAG: DUF883 domain-containing protein [Proteobacteria bacterium]|nr:DUF883 domain-containing protein [Pseudomonadota bacterium]
MTTHNATHNGTTTTTPDAAAAPTARDVQRKELMAECRKLVGDAEALLHRATGLSGDAYALARVELDERMVALRARYNELATEAARRGRVARDATDRYVRDNPWRSVATAAAVGAVFGALLCRRGD